MGTVNLAKIVERKSIENIFNEIDRNGDGYIDMEELKEIIGKYGVKLPENLTKINIDQF